MIHLNISPTGDMAPTPVTATLVVIICLLCMYNHNHIVNFVQHINCMKKLNIEIETHGCKLNFADSQSIAKILFCGS